MHVARRQHSSCHCHDDIGKGSVGFSFSVCHSGICPGFLQSARGVFRKKRDLLVQKRSIRRSIRRWKIGIDEQSVSILSSSIQWTCRSLSFSVSLLITITGACSCSVRLVFPSILPWTSSSSHSQARRLAPLCSRSEPLAMIILLPFCGIASTLMPSEAPTPTPTAEKLVSHFKHASPTFHPAIPITTLWNFLYAGPYDLTFSFAFCNLDVGWLLDP